MVPNKPVKKAQPRKQSVKSASKRTVSKQKGKKKTQKEMPAWCRYLLGVLIVAVFVSGSIGSLSVRMPIVGNLAMV